METELKKPFMEHLEELRQRLVKSAIAVAIGFIIAYTFSEKLFIILVKPLKNAMGSNERLIFTNLAEMFITYIKISVIAGILFAAPVIFYQFWKFVAPGLYDHEKKYVFPFVFFSTILFVGGALFGYFFVFPFGFKFFLSFANEYVMALPSVKDYFSFSIKLLFAFGIIFELPIFMFFMAKIGLITSETLKKYRRIAIVAIFIIAAILTPPDAFTQIMMAIPLLILYEISIYVCKISEKPHTQKEDKEQNNEQNNEGSK
jgi:sec-independent protein translocase protein TatC